MRPLSRVAAAGVVAGSLAGALALRPAPATATALTTTEPGLQAAAVVAVRADQARLAAAEAARAQAARAARAVAEARRLAAARAAAARAAALQVQRAHAAQARVTVQRPATAPRAATPVESPLARGQRVYAALHYDVGRLGYRMVFKPGAQGLLGMTDSEARTVTVYVRSTTSDLVLRHTIAHEIGHALDFTRGTALRHSRYLLVRGLGSGLAWYGCSTCTDYRTPAGDWAEVFAQWLAGPGDFRSQLAGVPSSTQLAALTALFAL